MRDFKIKNEGQQQKCKGKVKINIRWAASTENGTGRETRPTKGEGSG